MGGCLPKEKKKEPEEPRQEPKQCQYSKGRPYYSSEQEGIFPSVSRNEEEQFLLSESHKIANNPKFIGDKWNNNNIKGIPAIAEISAKERKIQTEKWIEMGKAEHASVASFSLFAQRLLAIGAPPNLIAEAFDCAKEEIEHAKYCFTLASYYAGYPIEPSFYQSHSVIIEPNFQSIVEGTIREGCISETISALSSALEFNDENDDYVRDILYKITKDEAHHAAFAWKFFKWSLSSSPSLVDHFIDAFDCDIEQYSGDQSKIDITLLRELKNILLNPSQQPSALLQSYLHLDDENDRFYLYSFVISQIYAVISVQ